jgi:hypothetical protein
MQEDQVVVVAHMTAESGQQAAQEQMVKEMPVVEELLIALRIPQAEAAAKERQARIVMPLVVVTVE